MAYTNICPDGKSGINGLLSRRSRVQIPSGPPDKWLFGFWRGVPIIGRRLIRGLASLACRHRAVPVSGSSGSSDSIGEHVESSITQMWTKMDLRVLLGGSQGSVTGINLASAHPAEAVCRRIVSITCGAEERVLRHGRIFG